MSMTLEELLADHSVDRDQVDAHKKRMLAEVRAYRLREICGRAASGGRRGSERAMSWRDLT